MKVFRVDELEAMGMTSAICCNCINRSSWMCQISKEALALKSYNVGPDIELIRLLSNACGEIRSYELISSSKSSPQF